MRCGICAGLRRSSKGIYRGSLQGGSSEEERAGPVINTTPIKLLSKIYNGAGGEPRYKTYYQRQQFL